MSEPIFLTNGDGIPPMLARTKLMDDVWSPLTKSGSKSGSSNLSVIGPRWIGKTVLLKAIADRAVDDSESTYSLVLHWHLGHVCPTTDAEFNSELCKQLRQAMLNHPNDYSDYQDYLLEGSYSHLKEITDLLDDAGESILMLWDGLDKPLGQDNLTIDLWDQMRSLIDGRKHKIVTATRAPLDLLIRNEKASTSEFWNIFDDVYIKPFDETNLDELIGLARLELTSGGKTELSNWTGGHPRLLLELLNRLAAGDYRVPIDHSSVVEAATGMTRDVRSWLRSIWNECPQAGQEAYQTLLRNGEANLQELGSAQVELLKDRGFAVAHRNKVKPSCNLLREHLRNTSGDSGGLARLFKAPDDFRSNIREVMRIKLEHIPTVDTDLQRWVGQSILGMPDHPGDCLTNLTDIRDRALDLVMQYEFGSERCVPEDKFDYWDYTLQKNNNKVISTIRGQNSLRIPNERALQIGLLQLLTGGIPGLVSRASAVSKDTYEMISAIHGLRNRKEHADGQSVSESVAVATIMTCLALLDRLASELMPSVGPGAAALGK